MILDQVNLVRFGYTKANNGGSILLSDGIFGFFTAFPNSFQVGMVNAGLNGFVVNLLLTSNIREFASM